MLLLDRMVHGQALTELVARGEELADGHAGGSLAASTGCVQHVPCRPKVLMLDTDDLSGRPR